MGVSTEEVKRFGRYQVLDELGRGAMGVVYRARDPQIGRIVAIKSISLTGQPPDTQSEYRERFMREAEAAGRISHPGIVTIFDVGEEPETHMPYIVMEYVKGKSLEQSGRLACETSLRLIRELAEALDCAHSAGVIHRDLKPSNILLTEDGHAKIADFGVAKLNLSELTSCGQILGTPAFMSPEQLNGDPVDGRSDLFSLGVILYTLLTGHRPFQGNSIFTVSFKVVHHEPISATTLNLTLPPGINDVVVRALAKDPAKRYQRGIEMAADIQNVLERQELGNRYNKSGTQSARRPKQVHLLGKPIISGIALASLQQSLRTPGSPLRKTWRTRAPWLIASVLTIVAFALLQSYRNDSKMATLPPLRSVPAAGELPEANTGSRSQRATLPGTFTEPPKSESVSASHTEGQAATVKKPHKVVAVSTASSSAQLKTGGAVVPRSAALQISVEHRFSNADLTLWVDDEPVLREKLEGGKKKFAPFGHAGAMQSQSIYVTPGTHQLRVHVQSVADAYDESDSLSADFPKDGERLLTLTFGKSKDMKVSLK